MVRIKEKVSIMDMGTNLSGRLRNTDLPRKHGLMPMFEAVVNSIHSFEEMNLPLFKSKITVEILRDTDMFDTLQKTSTRLARIIGFRITDNGVGFTQKNMDSFMTLDSDHKIEKGCRGIGRLMWLKAFNKVSVSSAFTENATINFRGFTLDARNGVNTTGPVVLSDSLESNKTVISLEGFSEEYQKAVAKETRAIAERLFEHCLWYFIRDGGAPKIIIQDGNDTIISAYSIIYLPHIFLDLLTVPSLHMNLPSAVHSLMPPFLPEQGVF